MPGLTPKKAVEDFYEAFNSGDLDAVAAFYEPRAVLLPDPGQVAQGSTTLKEALQGFMDLKPTLTLESHKVVTAGDLALSVAKWRLEGTGPDGKPVEMAGTATDVLRKQTDGGWRFMIDNPWGSAILD